MFPDDYHRYPEQYYNVFYLDEDPICAAQLHCDKHVVKMIGVTAQILSTVWHAREQPAERVSLDWGRPVGDTPPGELPHLNSLVLGHRVYRPAHADHPCVKWAGLYGGNYDWLYRLGVALLEEFTHRFNRVHACTPVVRALETVPPWLADTVGTWCDAPAVVSDLLQDDVVDQYRSFYKKGVLGAMVFTKRRPPAWLEGRATYLMVGENGF